MKRAQKSKKKSSPSLQRLKKSSSITRARSQNIEAMREITDHLKNKLLLREALPTSSREVVATDETSPEEVKEVIDNYKESFFGRRKRTSSIEGTGEEAVAALAKLERKFLQIDAILFRGREFYGPEKEHKTCIWPGGNSFNWTARSSGISWVGVNSTDTICVVSMTKPTRKRSGGRDQLPALTFLGTAVADMDGDDESFSFRRWIPESFKGGPFAVVSLAPSEPAISDQECHLVSRAVGFLMEKLKDRPSLSSNETTQIAVCALRYLVGTKFKSNEVEGMGFGKWRGSYGIMSEKRVLDAIKLCDSL